MENIKFNNGVVPSPEFIGVGGAMGALNPISKEADTHAELYYNAVRNRNDGDVKKIAHNAGLPEVVVADVKRHVFLATDHDLGGGKVGGFEPDYMIAQAWQRLETGVGIKDTDVLLLKHEFRESVFIRKYGYGYEDAHKEANKFFNWQSSVYPKEGRDV